ncbi:hemolysin family protein [Halopelagius longus]|uniref:Hemolysin, contains CBS domains n=1 Tax=Halopelagius longus TaxID=1236180 RepID=A0A1H0YAI4_9EURY|nr:hemolysin family protein [Halopelagius longus]RDI72379.1 HlyC/CorC family transporter [Halopelagius longus]SDQ12137.1 Hemolysin, contains CBS domains [Halopelagius longus]
MVDYVVSGLQILLALFLVFMNGFFVAAEFAFVRIRPTRVDALAEEGKSGAKYVVDAVENLDEFLAVSQLGITLSSLGLGWIGEPAVASLIEPLLGPVLPESAVHLVSFAVGFGIITFLHVVFGELAPKTMAIQEAEKIAFFVALPMKIFYYIFVPGIVVFNGTANYFTRLVGVSPASESEEAHTEDEILLVLSQSEEEGHIDLDEVEMIEGIFELGDTVAREIMVPRPDVVTVPPEMSLDELRSFVAEGQFTRYLVLDAENGEQAVGFVHIKDVLRATEAEERAAGAPEPTARDIAREVLVVPEDHRIDELLVAFRKQEIQMAVVIDEWGELEGIVTIEDIIEEVVGEIRDEFDAEELEPTVAKLEDGTYAADGNVSIEAVNEAVGSDFESDDFETIGGLVLSHLGRVPEVDDRVAVADYVLRVDGVEDTRISRVTITESEDAAPEPDAHESDE